MGPSVTAKTVAMPMQKADAGDGSMLTQGHVAPMNLREVPQRRHVIPSGKIRTEKEVVRLNSASGPRPQSSGITSMSNLATFPRGDAVEFLNVPARPVSNQSALRSSGTINMPSTSGPDLISAWRNVYMRSVTTTWGVGTCPVVVSIKG